MTSKQKLILSIVLISAYLIYYFGWDLIAIKIPFINWFYMIGFYLGYRTITAYSDFNESIYRKICFLFLSLTIIGTLFKVQHWPQAGALLIIGLCGIAITYFVRFIKKKSKQFPDYVKLIWVLSFSIGQLLVIQHVDTEGWLSLISKVVFLILLLYYISYDKKLKEQEKEVKEFLEKEF